MYKSKLSIAIPAYNKPEAITKTISSFITDAIKFNIPIYINDDSTNNSVRIAIQNIVEKYDCGRIIKYFKNENNLGHDLNCLKTLKLSKEKYVWYLGDSCPIVEGGIKKVISILEENEYDILVFNSHSRINLTDESKDYLDAKELIEDIGWHITKTGVTIYKTSLLDLEDFKSQSYPNFPQFAIIFRILYENKNFILRWENFKMIYGVGKKGSYWSNYAFETFVDDFGTTIKNLPQNFNNITIDGVIRKHSFRTGIFGYYNIINKRIDKQWGLYEFIKWRCYLIKYSKANIIILFLISVCPTILIKKLYSIYSNRL